MTRFTTTALALILASTPALAASHEEGGDAAMKSEETMQSGEMETEQAMDDGAMSEDNAERDSEMADAEMEDNDAADTMGMNPELIRTRDITGGNVYTLAEADAEAEWDADQSYDMVEDGWETVGEIEDIVLDKNGQMKGIVAEIGGFLDIGDKHVMLPVEDVRLVPVDNESYAVVTQASQEELRDLEEVDEGFWN